jgi:uncharacterized membrane protein
MGRSAEEVRMRPSLWLSLVITGALAGVGFAAVSTFDFAQHLDRQVHSIHCSFIPGLGRDAETGSGCQVAMMSGYSSVLRDAIWGGLPISLPAMGVFAFLFFYAADLWLSKRQDDPRRTGFLALATLLPALVSIVMAMISISELGTMCKLCVGIYVASAACFLGALVQWRRAVRASRLEEEGAPVQRTGFGALIGAFAIGVLFVAAPVGLYAAIAPDHDEFVGTCGALRLPDDPYGVMVPFGKSGPHATPAIEILDPLCPACRGFEQQLTGSGLAAKIERRAVLFPLDSTCNWMVDEVIHPGACAISEAVLCAGNDADRVIEWAFAEQDRIRDATAKDPGAAARIAKKRFPELASCIGSPAARSKLNKSLRWAVQNSLPVLTPQLYVNGVKLCDEDVDLGLVHALEAMLAKHARGELKAPAPAAAPPTPPAEHTPAPKKPAPAKAETPAAPAPAPEPAPEPAPAPAPVEAPSETPPPEPAPAPAEPTPEPPKEEVKP